MFSLGMKKCFANNKMFSGAGSDLIYGKRGSPKKCQEWCEEEPACDLFTYVLDRRVCYLKEKGLNPTLVDALNRVSGPKSCPGTYVIHICRDFTYLLITLISLVVFLD